jgi:putative transcriptional regulator
VTVDHHLDDATIMQYASGGLDEAFSVIVAAHLALCDRCRHAVRAGEEAGGRLLESGDGADLATDAFDRLMRRLDEGGERILVPARPAPPVADALGDVPMPLRRFIGPSLADIRWKVIAPGIRTHRIGLAQPASSSLYLLHIAEGKAVPEHGHGGAELTLILSGAYRDELGRFGRGDIADLDEDVEHQPRVEPGAPCICLVATETRTRFKGLISRLLQPLVGI